MDAVVTSAQVVPYKKLSKVRLDPRSFCQDVSKQKQFALLILEPDTGRIRMIHLDQNRVTKLAVETDCVTPDFFIELASAFEQHKISIIFSKSENVHSWNTKLRLDVFIRETDVTALCHSLEKIDAITKVEILDLFASD